jgi:predicted oxidoreductase
VGELPFSVDPQDGLNIVGGIAHFVALRAIADLQNHAIAIAVILQMMCRAIGGKARHHAGVELRLAIVREQRRLAFKDVNELVLPRVL